MAVQQRRKSSRKTKQRRKANTKIILSSAVSCKNCGAEKKPHYICLVCKKYKDIDFGKKTKKATKPKNETVEPVIE